jgi:hydroxymethylglutaryl-CoA lyase
MEAALKHYAIDDVSGHFHDTYGQALANTLACLEMGIWQYDTVGRRPGRLPLCQGRDRQRSPPRTWSTCCAAWE